MPVENGLAYRGSVTIYYANPVIEGDNMVHFEDASVYHGIRPNEIGVMDNQTGKLHGVNLDYVAEVTYHEWASGAVH